MPANRFGIDVGQLYREKEAIEGARTRNKMNALQLSEAQRVVDERPIREAAQQKRNMLLSETRQKASTGDVTAQQKLLSIDPEGGPKFIDAVSKMDDRQIEATKNQIDLMGRMSATILNAKPEKQAMLYSALLEELPQEAKSKMPKDLDLNFLEVSLAKARSMDQILENPKAVTVGDQNILYKGGREIERGKVPAKSGTGGSGSGSGGLKSGDESLMYRQAAELLGGMFDEAGNLRALDPEIRPKVQAIATRASELFKQGGVTRSQAVTMAAEELEGADNSGDNDPLGIR